MCAAVRTPLRFSRGIPGPNTACTHCYGVASLGHISQVCPATHNIRVKRHDGVCKFISGRLRQKGFMVVQEPRFPYVSFCKPDMVIWKPRDNEATILDTQVVSDGFPLAMAHERKVLKYNINQILEGVKQLASLDPSATISVSSATLSCRGCWSRGSADTLRRNHADIIISI